MDTPRAYTKEEARDMFIEHLRMLAKYWATTDLNRPEFKARIEADGEILYRLEGLLHSVFVTLDGGSGDMPAFDVSPAPHPSDEQYLKERGENWWPVGEVINDCQLHEIFWLKKPTHEKRK